MSLGEIIKKERNHRNLKLHEVATDCGISESQIYRIENNDVNISKSTLIKLASYFGHDIIPSYTDLVNDDIVDIWQSISDDIKSRDINKMGLSLDIIEYVNKKSTNVIVSSVSKQYYYLIKGLICLHQDEFLEARKFFLKGMESFNPHIDTSTFNNIGSSSLQLRLLIGYAVTYKEEYNHEKNLRLLSIVSDNARGNNEIIHKKTIYNMANMYSFIEDYNKSLEILNKYIDSQRPKTTIDYDNIIYFKKATVSYRLGYDNYEKYALRALYSSVLSNDIHNGLLFLRVFNNLFDTPIMTKEEFLSL